ncbi:acyltransferase family protein [Arthrobacter sp. A2-55]|uniref:acyltransferase family protein n=1 Tax=Arthrobacter sp. A2-55 TaxID=2897337 RepID=UPI0021CD9328|nr:acyltransferase [Arthrobacter sp. A2-55]MCU6479911.1 acyltransferase [Arthrobacter sp. A2-55]
MPSKSVTMIHSATKLPALTGLRFLAAFAVLISHFNYRGVVSVPTAIINFVDGGRTAVSLFFVLSGFILAYNYSSLSGRSGRIKFYASRFARIYPVTILAVVLGSIGVIYALLNRSTGALLDWYSLKEASVLNLGGSLFAQITTLTGWLPAASLNQPWNSPAWSISCEVFFYALFPALVVVMRKLSSIHMTILLLSAFVGQCLIIFAARTFFPLGQEGFIVFQFPLTHLFEFLIGVAAALLFIRGGEDWMKVGCRRIIVLAASLTILSTIAVFRPIDPAFLLMSPFFALLILALAVKPKRQESILAWRPVVLLGEASFSLYMIHVPLLNLYSVGKFPNTVGWILMTMTILLSIGVYKWFETPLRIHVRSAIVKRALGTPKRHLRTDASN